VGLCGYDPNIQDYNGETALMKAIEKSHVEVVEYLVSISDPKLNNRDGWSPLMMAVKGGFNDLIELLMLKQPQIDVHHRSEDGLTPLLCAVLEVTKGQ
jgi:ankyrin repeat protein